MPLPKFPDKSFVFKNNDARKELKKMALLAWAQEVPSSNLGASTTYCFIFQFATFIDPQRQKPKLGFAVGTSV
jgi:hypothetical protein